MHKVRIFCILFFVLSAVSFQYGCAKKIDSAMSSAGIDDGKSAGAAVKQEKPGNTAGGRADKETGTKAIGEEPVGKAASQGETVEADKSSKSGEASSQGISGSIVPSGEAKEGMAKAEADPSDPRKGSGESIQMPESSQDGISSEVMKKDEEKPLKSPGKEIMVASKVEPGSALEGLRKGREDKGLKDIFFDFNSWIAKGEFIGMLEQDAKYLILNPGLKVLIEGHADERGTNEYNLALGERRAKSTRKFLVDMGVDPERITIISYGEERPFCRDHEDSCWGNNRRGHFLIIGD